MFDPRPREVHVCTQRNRMGKTLSPEEAARVERAFLQTDYGAKVWEEAGGMSMFDDIAEVAVLPSGYSMKKFLQDMAKDEEQDGDPFYIVDLSVALRKLQQWRELMPRVKPFYAIKANPDPALCTMLAKGGCGFDCASQAEIEQVLEMGCAPESIIYANPCKQPSMLRFVRDKQVFLMTADNQVELDKIRDLFPEARVVLRIAVDDSKSVCRFNSKYGAPQATWRPLLQQIKRLGLEFAGVSFHVGSGCSDTQPFADAVASAREVVDMAKTMGFHPTVLDIGGGFPGTDTGDYAFSDVCETLCSAIDEHFPPGCGLDILAEPGRYFSTDCHTYAVQVIAKRALTESQLDQEEEVFGAATQTPEAGDDDEKERRISDAGPGTNGHHHKNPDVALYINDGVFGSFNCVVFDHAIVVPMPIFAPKDVRPVRTKIFGPTCDGIDVVMPLAKLPSLETGDWLYFESMGAYTRCAASHYSGHGAYSVHYVWEEGCV